MSPPDEDAKRAEIYVEVRWDGDISERERERTTGRVISDLR
jgi:hypothetical protein